MGALLDSTVSKAAVGDANAIALLFDRHWQDAWIASFRILGNRAEADDVAQDAFLQSVRRLGSFDGRSSYRTWLVRIAINASLDVVRGRREQIAHEYSDEGRIDDAHRRGQLRDALYSAIQGLPEDRRTVVVMRYWLDLTPPEIAEIASVPLGTVHSRLARGVDALRRELEVTLEHAI